MATALKGDTRVKTSNLYRAMVGDFFVDPTFNVRDTSKESTRQKIEEMASCYKDGRKLPPLLICYDDQRRLMVIDGHCRLSAAKLAVERGWVPSDFRLNFDEHKGNAGERVAFMLRSGDVQDPLTPLEIADGYRRLRGLGYDEGEIAAMVGKPKATVARLLKLADADKGLQDLVRDGTVATSTVLEAINTMAPDEARRVLLDAVGVAKEDGRDRARPADVRKVMSAAGANSRTRAFGRSVPKELRPHLERLRDAATAGGDVSERADDDPVPIPFGVLRPILALVNQRPDEGVADQ